MDFFRDKGLIHLIKVMPETDYGARELEECSGWGGTEVQGQANQATIMTNTMTSQPQRETGQAAPGLEEIMTGAQLAQWEWGNNKDSLLGKRDWDKMKGSRPWCGWSSVRWRRMRVLN
jgi:hypothetical protein